MERKLTIAVIGAGTMGHGFAQLFAQHGHPVSLTDRTVALAQKGREMIKNNLKVVVEEGFLAEDQIGPTFERVKISPTIADAVGDADFVIEAVFENLPTKLECWRTLSAQCPPEAIVATNTSSFDISELASVMARPERAIGTHWFNPPQIVPCVEVIPGKATEPDIVRRTVGLLRSVGKEPSVTKSVPGFVANRIQLVMAAEAFRCLEEGVASAEDIDRIVKTSFGFRLGAYGVFEIADLAGLDTYKGVYDYLVERYRDKRYEAPEMLSKLVQEGRIGVKAAAGVYTYTEEEGQRLRAERDHNLYARLQAFRAERDAAKVKAATKSAPSPTGV